MSKQAETNVWRQALLDFSPLGFRLFRNQRYKGQVVRNGKVTQEWVNCGLADGMGDLVGYKIITVTPEMVGKRFAQFATLEAKTDKGYPSADQTTMIYQISLDGGIAGVIRPKTKTEITAK